MRQMLLAATALAMLSGGAAYAQTSTSGSNSQSSATNSSASQSSSTSNPRVNVIGTSMGNGTSSSVSGSRATANTQSRSQSSAVGNRSNITVNTYAGIDGSGSSSSGTRASAGGASGGSPSDPSAAGGDPAYSINYSGGYSVRNVPEVIAPNVVGGNPCAIGASGGLAVSGFGISGGATWADKQCERRQQAALLFNIGKQRAAVELMCQDDNVRVALRVSGEPCTADQAIAQKPATIAAALLVPAVAAPVAAVATPVAAQNGRPEWCYTASEAERRRHAECDVRS